MSTGQSADEWVAAAHQLHLAGRLGEAEAGYRRALSVSGRNADALRFLGALLLQRDDATGAIPLLERAAKLKPGAAVWVNLAAAYRGAGDPDRAITSCRRALAFDKTMPAAYFNLGHAYRDLAKLPEAADAYRAFLKLEPRDVEGHVVLGDTLRLMSAPDAAMEAYQAALVYDPAHVNAHVNVAGIIASEGFFHAALAISKPWSVSPLDPPRPGKPSRSPGSNSAISPPGGWSSKHGSRAPPNERRDGPPRRPIGGANALPAKASRYGPNRDWVTKFSLPASFPSFWQKPRPAPSNARRAWRRSSAAPFRRPWSSRARIPPAPLRTSTPSIFSSRS
jgi:Tfp pilus assembly protein PilF